MSNQIPTYSITQKPIQSKQQKPNQNPLFSPSTSCKTTIQLQNNLKLQKSNQSKFNHFFIKPLPSLQLETNSESIIYQPNASLTQVKTNLTQKFASMVNSPNIITDKEKEVNNCQYDLISRSNSQSSLSHQEKSLIDNLIPIEPSFAKRSKIRSEKQVSYEGVIELKNTHTDKPISFRAYKDEDIWSVPINYNFLLQEREDEGISSDDERLTQSTHGVLTELLEGINIFIKDNKSQIKKTK